MTERTRIRILDQIENECFELLPPEPYLKGYLFEYARALELPDVADLAKLLPREGARSTAGEPARAASEAAPAPLVALGRRSRADRLKTGRVVGASDGPGPLVLARKTIVPEPLGRNAEPVSPANPWALPSLLATALSLGLCSSRPRAPSAPPLWPSLPISLLGGVVFAVGDVLSSFVARDPITDAVGLFLLYSGVLLLSSSAWILALRVAEVQGAPFSWGRSPWARAPVVFAALMGLIVLTNPWHGWFLTRSSGPATSTTGSGTRTRSRPTP